MSYIEATHSRVVFDHKKLKTLWLLSLIRWYSILKLSYLQACARQVLSAAASD